MSPIIRPVEIPKKLRPSDLETFQAHLLDKREELVTLYRHDVKVGQESNDDSSDDFADRANNCYNRELMFSLSDTERSLVQEVDRALDRLDAGAFGSCTHCGDAIGLDRLYALPWARYCIVCQERKERGMLD